MKTQLERTPGHGAASTANVRWPASQAGSRTILLISRDQRLLEDVRSFANSVGFLMVRVDGKAGLDGIIHALKPVAVLLDLDLPGGTAWELAERLLEEPGCPAMILITGQTGQFDLITAIRAGLLISKDESPARLLEVVQEVVNGDEVQQAERNTVQRMSIRWLKPSDWSGSAALISRFSGINE